jgi:hypothetical protein
MVREVFLAAVLVGSSALVAVPARTFAQDAPATPDDAATAFAEGERAFEAGDFGRAAAAFDRAFAARPHEAALWNAARSYERNGDEVRAANRYRAFLDVAGPSAPDRDRATASLTTLAKKIGRLDLVASGAERLVLDGSAATSGAIYVAPGIHHVEATFAGIAVPREIEIAAGQRINVTLSAPGDRAPAPPLAPTTAPSAAPPPSAAPAGTPRSAVPIWPAIVLGGLTGVSLGLSIASGVDVLVTKGDFDDEVEAGASVELQRVYIEQGVSKTTRTNVLYGVTGALAIATAVTLVFTIDWSDTPAAPRVTSRGGGVVAPF